MVPLVHEISPRIGLDNYLWESFTKEKESDVTET